MTVSFTIHGVNSAEVGKFLAEKGLFVGTVTSTRSKLYITS